LIYRAINRGNNRQDVFFVDDDRSFYLTVLKEQASRCGLDLLGYCLMTNHVHLLVTPPSADACVALMRNLGQRYVQYVNRTHLRTGTLWEGRYRSCLVQSARYVLACYRYIELNPVRAAMVSDPEAYRWSSYWANTQEEGDSWLTPCPEFLNLDDDPARRRKIYRALVQDGMDAMLLDDVRKATSGGYPLGSDRFKAALAETSRRRVSRGRSGRRQRSGHGFKDSFRVADPRRVVHVRGHNKHVGHAQIADRL